ncbi:chitosanase [Actinoplanes sp. NBRC 101535]|uniref:chitosanase n=1 Tax=Actinoplanes sp. NBRC 101535 TaxID=3032196 RepID=UPI0024A4BAA9|nr:chitosanase [Actinoplanes sp. NBRC 101535]GLY03477.1 hypothetical protein Acsp01_38560 [Actinoplanes sp. NBRC 101535]
MWLWGESYRSVLLGGGIAVVLCIPPAVSVVTGVVADVLLTRGRPVLASSTQDATVPAAGVVDDDPVTRWASAAGSRTEWIRVDLGAAQQVRRVRLNWGDDHATAYRVQMSDDGATWADIRRVTGGTGGADDLHNLDGTGRYLRVLATRRSGEAGYSLFGIRAYGPGPAAPVPEAGRSSAGVAVPDVAADLTDEVKRETAFRLVSSAENSTLDWRHEYAYIEDIGDGRGYTGGIIGFCSGTSDMLAVVSAYTRQVPGNPLERFLPALRAVDGSDSHDGLDPGFTAAWRAAADDPAFRSAQDDARDRVYFNPAVRLAVADGLRALGQFAYYDAAVMHGPAGLRKIRARAMAAAHTPATDGEEITYLNAFLDARSAEMRTEEAHSDTSRVETAQRLFLRATNLDLAAPLTWKVYGDRYTVTR